MKEYILNINNRKTYLRYNDLEPESKEAALVFIPGWGCASSFDFVELAASPLISGRRKILIDLLGAGYSDRPEDFDYRPESHAKYIAQLLKSLELDKFIIYAHSMGGRVALALAELMPHRLEGMILSEGSMQQEYFPYMDKGEEVFSQEYFPKMLASLARKEDQKFLATVRLAYPAALYREAREMMEPESKKWEDKFLKASYKKVFIVGLDTDDQGFNLEKIKSAGLKIIALKGAGHSMNWDQPLKTGQALREALDFMDQEPGL